MTIQHSDCGYQKCVQLGIQIGQELLNLSTTSEEQERIFHAELSRTNMEFQSQPDPCQLGRLFFKKKQSIQVIQEVFKQFV